MMGPRRVAIVQSSYLPWKGYFDLVNLADEFILLDDVQYTRRDWRSRNRIKTAQGLRWLTIPVATKGRYRQRIDEVRVVDPLWQQRHWKSITHAYSRAPWFRAYGEWLRDLYVRGDDQRLSDINRRFLQAVCDQLGITTPLSWSTDHAVRRSNASERLAALVEAVAGEEYVSGPSARSYLRLEPFHERGISVQFVDYTGYREYPQIHGEFDHRVTILDLLLHVGPEAPAYMKSFGGTPALVPAAP